MANKIKKAAAYLAKGLLTALLAAAAFSMAGYLAVPVRDFGTPAPFGGDSIYNPYRTADFSTRRKAIFHSHSTRSDGKDSPGAMVAAHERLGYDIISLSDHNTLKPYDNGRECYLGTYEHGISFQRFHSVVFGAERTATCIPSLWMPLSVKYHMLERLDRDFEIVVFNHPEAVRFLSDDEMMQLSHYMYIEADMDMETGRPAKWDTALSAGHYSFVMANDDLHDLARPNAIGRRLTFLLTGGTDRASVFEALRRGHSYAYRMWYPPQSPDSLCIPRVTDFRFADDTISVGFSDPADILFIGQGGAVRKREEMNTRARYRFTDEDTYIRVEARFGNHTFIYLNPLARHPASIPKPVNASYASVNPWLTALWAAGHCLLGLLCLWGIYIVWRRRKNK